MADLVGIYLVMSRVSGKGSVKVLIAGLGWAFAELVLTRFNTIPDSYSLNLDIQACLSLGRRTRCRIRLEVQTQIIWAQSPSSSYETVPCRYIQKSFEANISLLHFITIATLVWMWTKRNSSHGPG